jgi:hypothetical protein
MRWPPPPPEDEPMNGPATVSAHDPAAVLQRLADELAAEESIVSPHVRDPEEYPALGALVAAGPRTASDPAGYAAVIESIREGYLLHFGTPRIVTGLDRDLALLAGDYLYAKGLLRLAGLDDPAAVAELSDLISLSAQLHAEPEPATTAPAWLACAVAIAAGAGADHERAKDALRRGGDGAALYEAAARTAREAGLDEQLAAAAETVRFPPSNRG